MGKGVLYVYIDLQQKEGIMTCRNVPSNQSVKHSLCLPKEVVKQSINNNTFVVTLVLLIQDHPIENDKLLRGNRSKLSMSQHC
jgi:hypothetical protein